MSYEEEKSALEEILGPHPWIEKWLVNHRMYRLSCIFCTGVSIIVFKISYKSEEKPIKIFTVKV